MSILLSNFGRSDALFLSDEFSRISNTGDWSIITEIEDAEKMAQLGSVTRSDAIDRLLDTSVAGQDHLYSLLLSI